MQHLLLFFLLAYSLSWLFWAPLWLPALGVHGLPVLPYHHALGAFGPLLAAGIMAWREQGREGVRDLTRRLVLWPRQFTWMGIALAGPFVLVLIALALYLVGGMLVLQMIDSAVPFRFPDLSGLGVSREFPQFNALQFFLYNLLTFGYGEETGWRGYALPRLQSRYGALTSSLLLTIGWAAWHIPLFLYRPGYTEMGIGGIIGWVVSLVTGSILLTWLFNASRGSLLVVAVFHATVDIVFTSSVADSIIVSLTGMLITFWGLWVIRRYGATHLAETERQQIPLAPPGNRATI